MTVELLSVASHMSYRMLYYCTPLYCLSVQHSLSRGNGRFYRLRQGNGGNYYNCASRVCGALFGSFLFAEVRNDERRLMILGVGGICQKELFASCPSVKYGWHRPPGLRRLGADSSVVLLPRLLTPRRGNPRVEWMLPHFYECFSVHSFSVTPAGLPATVIRLNIML